MAKVSVRTIFGAAEHEQALAIRRRVFVEEQGVPAELEADDLDARAYHVGLFIDLEMVGTARMTDHHGAARIGRVAVLAEHRGQGYGEQLTRFMVEAATLQGYAEAVLSSQRDAVRLYEKVGFERVGEVYVEAGIPHLWMRLALTAS